MYIIYFHNNNTNNTNNINNNLYIFKYKLLLLLYDNY
jgi:hypothetical protein